MTGAASPSTDSERAADAIVAAIRRRTAAGEDAERLLAVLTATVTAAILAEEAALADGLDEIRNATLYRLRGAKIAAAPPLPPPLVPPAREETRNATALAVPPAPTHEPRAGKRGEVVAHSAPASAAPAVRPDINVVSAGPSRARTAYFAARNVALVVVAVLAWTSIATGHEQRGSQHRLRAALAAHQPAAAGLLTVPRLGVSQVVVPGTGRAQLRQGPGLVDPQVAGPTVIAGHRSAYGAPFAQLGTVVLNDVVTWRGVEYHVSWVGTDRPPSAPRNALVLITAEPRFVGTGRFVVEALRGSAAGPAVAGAAAAVGPANLPPIDHRSPGDSLPPSAIGPPGGPSPGGTIVVLLVAATLAGVAIARGALRRRRPLVRRTAAVAAVAGLFLLAVSLPGALPLLY